MSKEAIKDGCENCPYTESGKGRCSWGGFVGDCPYNTTEPKKPEPAEFTKKARLVRERGATHEQWEYATLLMEACDIIDRQADELKKAYGRITALSLKEGRVKIADIYQEQQAEINKLNRIIDERAAAGVKKMGFTESENKP